MTSVYVYPHTGGWAVKRFGGKITIFPTQKKAVTEARTRARRLSPSQVVVLGRGGAIRASIPYGLPKILRHPLPNPNRKRIERAVGLMVLEKLAADERG